MSPDFWPQVISAAGAAVAASGIVGAAMKAHAARTTSTARQQADIFHRQEERIERVERKEAECQERLARVREELGALRVEVRRIGEYATAIVVADEQGLIVEWNETATQVFGWTATEAIGQSVSMLVPPAIRGQHEGAFAAAAKEHRGPSERASSNVRDSIALRKDGTQVMVTVILRGWERAGARFYSAEIRRR